MSIVVIKLLLFAAVLGLTGVGLHVLKQPLGLAGRYYLLLGTTAWLVLLAFVVPVSWSSHLPVLSKALGYWRIALCFAVCWHSGVALFHPGRIPVLLSVPCLVVSGICCCMATAAALLWAATGGVGLAI